MRWWQVSIEGNIASGKSTILRNLSQFKNVEVCPMLNIIFLQWSVMTGEKCKWQLLNLETLRLSMSEWSTQQNSSSPQLPGIHCICFFAFHHKWKVGTFTSMRTSINIQSTFITVHAFVSCHHCVCIVSNAFQSLLKVYYIYYHMTTYMLNAQAQVTRRLFAWWWLKY